MRFATSTLFFVLKVYCFCTDFCTGAEVKSVLKSAFVKECKRIFQVFLANLRRFFLSFRAHFYRALPFVSSYSADINNGTDEFLGSQSSPI